MPGSDAITIRDAAFDRISRLEIAGTPIKSVRRIPLMTIQPTDLPCLGVFILNEKGVQDGSVTLPQFVVTLELGVSLALMASDPRYLDGSLDAFAEAIKNTLFTDTSFLVLFEYATLVNREYSFPRDGETYMAELRMRLSFTFRSNFQPPAPYALTMVDVQTPPSGTPSIDTQIPLTGG